MAEACEAEGGSLAAEEEDEEREPLLPRVAWAQPRKGAPGSAVRLLEAAGDAGDAGEAGDGEELLLPGDSAGCASRDVGVPRTSPTDLDRSRLSGAGASSSPLLSARGPSAQPMASALSPSVHALPGRACPYLVDTLPARLPGTPRLSPSLSLPGSLAAVPSPKA